MLGRKERMTNDEWASSASLIDLSEQHQMHVDYKQDEKCEGNKK